MLIDLHTHTRGLSWDSDLSPDQLIDAAKHAGLDGICLTEHDFFWDHDAARELARKHDFLVLPGIEINTDDGHVLCFGLEKYVYGMHRWHELATHVQGAGGVMVAAHPYRRRMPWHPDKEDDYAEALARAVELPYLKACAAVERYNGRGAPAENAFANHIVDALGMPGVASSDCHQLKDVGRCATEFLGRIESLEDLIAALRAGRVRPALLASDLSLTTQQTRDYPALPASSMQGQSVNDTRGDSRVTQEQAESLITDEMRASIGREGPPSRLEVEKTGIRMFARAVGQTDLIYYDEDYAKSKGHRSLVAPEGFFGTPIYDPSRPPGGPGAPAGRGGRLTRALNGGSEYEYYGIDICAGDVLTAVSKTVDISERQSSLGQMLITRRETTYTNQNGEVVARAYGTGLQY
ncbi:MAG TPA: MaoC family dehydratase N-terminal domain-containing protein [Dehalococcoidia bacterium]|nr:MaoC family dehydratase N-terminal domain-containing protein [Dehalococcoidia bacterium]